jgi:hypothetical protein
MRAIAVVLTLAATLVCQGWTAAPAAACSCTGADDQESYDQADAVFVGEVTSSPSIPTQGTWSSADPGVWTFRVSEVYKGDVAADQRVVSVLSGASCGLELPTEGKVVVFADSEPAGAPLQQPVEGAQLYAYLCGGSRSLQQAALPSTFGTPAAPGIDVTGDVDLEGADPANSDSGARNLALPIVAGVGLLILVAAIGTLVVRRSR